MALFPLFLKLAGRKVLVVGGGPVASAKVAALRDAGAEISVVAPEVEPGLDELARAGKITLVRRSFEAVDLGGAWFVVAAATPEVNRGVAAAAESQRLFVLAVDDPSAASAYGAGALRRGGVTVAISTDGRAPALAGLLREGLDAVLPDDLEAWTAEAEKQRAAWRAAKVPMAERRPLLLRALNRIYDARDAAEGRGAPNARAGQVVIVGAGPGSADLITVRGAERLAEADLVLYDALASEQLRALAPRARWFFVGKRACRQSISQDVLNRLLIKYARRGLAVVRLKCGDPYVFGRGGEEALALARAGIPFEVVPGVSSAVAAPALAGIPVTHRGLASSFAVVTGHHETTYGPLLDGFPPGALTVVVLMGLGQRARIAERLLARGWASDTPAAVIVGAATAQSWSWTGTLAGLKTAGVEIPTASTGAPGLLVVGAVVGLAAELAAGLSLNLSTAVTP